MGRSASIREGATASVSTYPTPREPCRAERNYQAGREKSTARLDEHSPRLCAIRYACNEGGASSYVNNRDVNERTLNTHHRHRMVVFTQSKMEILQELLCDLDESILVELELALNVVEDLARRVWGRAVHCGYLRRHVGLEGGRGGIQRR